MQEFNETECKKVFLTGVDTGEDRNFEQSMKELESLAEACFMKPVGCIIQTMPAVNKALCLGSGKVLEVKEAAKQAEAEMVIFDNTLSPIQMRNLQKELELSVMDRTGLILDIFSNRAKTKEAKLQVETATLKYMLPRLVGMHEALSRQGGASGSMSNKGAGEKKLELDRRRIEHRLAFLQKELKEVSKERQTQRKKRENSSLKKVALVGYTNAGKSTIMNSMVSLFVGDENKKVLEKDMLFATLETSVRLIEGRDHKDFFLSDTVGFIHKLPHDLVEAFQSTLEEVASADLLLHVVDFSDPSYKQHMEVTKDTLIKLGAGDIPTICVYNKVDLYPGNVPREKEDSIYLSAHRQEDILHLVEKIKQLLYGDFLTTEFLFPYDKGGLAAALMEHSEIIEQKYVENGMHLVVNCHKKDVSKYQEYCFKERKISQKEKGEETCG